MNSKELRNKYLKFFESKGHLIHPSDSLIPDDASLLYTAAGMVQFKPYFVGERIPPNTRITTSQKCMRTDDIDEVGDAVHHTFFEMLGNFSFGDYFKREAILWAWEFLTEVLELDPDRLWTSVYFEDDEAYDIWVKEVKFPQERIVRLGEDKNYWPANAPSKGPNGPCGPCNEIFLDVSPELGMPQDPVWSIAHDGNRFVEIWNLVFTQFDRQEDGSMKPLPAKNIDTGMGLERTIAVLNGTKTDYETDLFLPLVNQIEKLSGASYGENEETDKCIRVIADHTRAAVFAIADGVMPSNMGRGYVLRRIIRNAIVKGRNLGLEKAFAAKIVPTVVDMMGDIYNELIDRQEYITKVIDSEEEKFRRTLESGLQRLEEHIKSAKDANKILSGEDAFTLYDTYGFPLELTKEIAAQSNIEVDLEGFNIAMEEQRQRAKEASGFAASLFGGSSSVISEIEKTIDPTIFVGYDYLQNEGCVVAILKDGELISNAEKGDEVDVILDTTSFYAESGGQVGDTGRITSENCVLHVNNTVKVSNYFVHKCVVNVGSISIGDKVTCQVDGKRRMAIGRNHTATHLLHSALRKIIGEHALQAGSEVTPDRLRFDFSHFQAVSKEEIKKIEDMVNSMILADAPTDVVLTSIDEARKMGATALFGEKYGDTVRVVRMGDLSTELCGGTHLCHTSQVGLFKIISESSIGAGLRRIEAVTGEAALQYVYDIEEKLLKTAEVIGSSVGEVVVAAERLMQNLKQAQKELAQQKAKGAANTAGELADKAEEINGVKFVTAKLAVCDVPLLQTTADTIADKLGSGVVIIAGCSDEKLVFIGKVTQDLVKKGFHAGNILKETAKAAGGGGGGRPDFAQAGGKDVSKVDSALEKAVEMIRKQASEN